MQGLRLTAQTRTIAIVALMMCATVATVAAQGTTGSLSGFVTDGTKAALPGATVTTKHVDTG
jgi:hypothetical protein